MENDKPDPLLTWKILFDAELVLNYIRWKMIIEDLTEEDLLGKDDYDLTNEP